MTTAWVTLNGKNFVRPDGTVFFPFGTNARWNLMRQDDGPYLAGLGLTSLRIEFPIFQTGVAGDAYDPSSPSTAYLSQAYLDQLDQYVEWFSPYLLIHIAVHSKCYRGGVLDDGVTPDPYCGDVMAFPNGANLWSDPTKKALWLGQVAFLAARYATNPRVYMIEPLNEPDPPNYTDVNVNAMMGLGVAAIQAANPNIISLVGGNGGYANFKINAAFMPGVPRVAYTWDWFDQPGSDPDNPLPIETRENALAARLAQPLSLRESKGVALFCQQFGSQYGVDPGRDVLAYSCAALLANEIPCSQWEEWAPTVGPTRENGTFGWRHVDTDGSVITYPVDEAIMAQTAAGFVALSPPVPVPPPAGPPVPAKNSGTFWMQGADPVPIVSLLAPDDTLYARAPKVIDGNVRQQMMLADPATGAPLDLQAQIAAAAAAFANSDLVLARQINKAGYTALWATASADGGRTNPLHNIADPGSYSRTSGVVQLVCTSFPDADENRYCKVAFANRPDLWAIVQLISAEQVTGGTLIVAREILTDTIRPDVAEGSVTDQTGIFHDLQAGTNCHPQITMLNAMLGGCLDVAAPLGIGGSNSLDWSNDAVWDYIDGMPYFDFGFVSFGYGNDLTDVFDPSSTIFARIDAALTRAEARCRHVFFLGAEGARPGGDDSPQPDPYNAADYTSLQLLNTYMRAMIQTRHKTVIYVDGQERFMHAAMQGSVDTYEITHGLPPQEFFDDGGIHRTPTGGLETARGVYEKVAPFVIPYNPTGMGRPDFVGMNTTPDLGNLTNPNMLPEWAGAVPQVAVLVNGLVFAGNGVAGSTADGSGFTSNMSGSIAVVDDILHGGRMMVLNFNDPVDGGAVFNYRYRGYTTSFVDDNGDTIDVDGTVLTAVNNPANQGVDLDLFGDFEWGGITEDGVLRFEAGLYVVDSNDVEYQVAAWYSDQGNDTMANGHRAWTRGVGGMHRAGNRAIQLPGNSTTPRTWSDAYIKFSWTGVPIGSPPYVMGSLWVEIYELQLRLRTVLAAPAPTSWS